VTSNSGICWLCVVMVFCMHVRDVNGQVCVKWKESAQVGTLQVQVREASGLAASRKFPGRLYHINDSGDNGTFYTTDSDGKNTKAVAIENFKPQDTEALSLGPCGVERACLFIGDIGDNERRRQSIEIVVVDEAENFPKSVKPRQRLRLRYPDGPHDSESMAVHPDGTIFILTKESPARLFRVDPRAGTPALTAVMTLDVGGAPTDISISDDGSRLLALTYLEAVEFGIDFGKFTLRYRQKIPIQFLQQQEAVTYLAGGRSFIYSSERFLLPEAWIMRVDCGGK
jgi:hypothetical protein